jgi:FkbM family methyltransferase
MKTVHKIALAKIAYNLAHGVRRIVGKTDQCVVIRGGNRFALDLAEGIDFAVYLWRYEPSTMRALARLIRPGTSVFDIGANVGVHTVHMAHLVGPQGKVFAFEPTTFAFRKMQYNLALNPGLPERVVATNCFLGPANSESAPTAVYSSWPLKGGASLHPKHLGQPMPTNGVASLSVDEFLAERGNPPIALVKLDVDGYECDVLAGATLMMQRDRPIFVMEIAPYALEEHGKSLGDMFAYFTPLGYRFFDERVDQPLAIDKIFQFTRDGAGINVVARAAS